MYVCPQSYIRVSLIVSPPSLPLCSENIITVSSLKWVISCVEDATTAVLWLLNGTEQWSMEPLGERAGTNFNPGMGRWLQTQRTHTRTCTHAHIHWQKHTHKHTDQKMREGERNNKQQHVGHFLDSHEALTEIQTDRLSPQNKVCVVCVCASVSECVCVCTCILYQNCCVCMLSHCLMAHTPPNVCYTHMFLC